jgi:hypothetical protein
VQERRKRRSGKLSESGRMFRSDIVLETGRKGKNLGILECRSFATYSVPNWSWHRIRLTTTNAR